MKRNLIFTLALLLGSTGAFASPLTPDEALARVKSAGPKKVMSKIRQDMKPVLTVKSENGVLGAYLFSSDSGFMIVSADDVAYPLLGYGDENIPTSKDVSPELKWWLGEYSRQIEWAVKNNVSQASSKRSVNNGWTAVGPLCKTLWDQDKPYNDMCPGRTSENPPAGEAHAYTGCVATSMAQVMKYFNYPEKGTGGVIYTPAKLGYKLFMRFSEQAFDWNNMLNSYTNGNYNQTQADAVAYLMKCCGYSVNMNYGFDASGASGSSIGNALRKYFKYDIKTIDRYRLVYTSDEWEEMIYDNLKNIGPVIMNGQSPMEGGHSFICDGYDGAGYFHFNWGWSGVGNGYYSLDALNPDAQGIGGAIGGFNFMQNAIFGIQPPKGEQIPFEAQLTQYGDLEGSISGNELTLTTTEYKSIYYSNGFIRGWYNSSDRTIKIKFGAQITSLTDPNFEPVFEAIKLGGSSEFILDNSYGMTTKVGNFNLPALPDGEYKVTLACVDVEYYPDRCNPVKTPNGYANYVLLTVNNGKYEVKNIPTSSLSFDDVKIASDLYPSSRVLMSVKVSNNSDIQLSKGFAPRLYKDGKVQFEGESIMVSLNPGETKEVEWVTSFTKVGSVIVMEPTDFNLVLYNPETGENIGTYGEVTMNPSLGKLNVMVSGFNIPNSVKHTNLDIDGRNYLVVYQVEDPSDIEFILQYTVKSGYFDALLRFSIEKMEGGIATPFKDDVYSEWQMKKPSTTPQDIICSVNMADDDPETVYALTTSYTSGYSQMTFGTFYFMLKDLSSGVNDVIYEDSNSVEYFNLQGQKIMEPKRGEVIIIKKGLQRSKVIY